MAILVDAKNLKYKKHEKNKFELNKLVYIIVFIISMFIVNLISEIIDSVIDISSFFGEFYDLAIILVSLFITYVYLRRKYINKEHTYKGFSKLKVGSDKNIIGVVPEILTKLNNNNYILKNLSFNNSNGINYIDTLVINKSGIFIIYTRYDKGKINGDEKENKWIVSNGKEDKKINNPIIIVNRQREKLKEYLKRLGYNIEIKSIIYYADRDLELNVKYNLSDVYIFEEIYKNDLISYIEHYKSKIKIDPEILVDKILKIEHKNKGMI